VLHWVTKNRGSRILGFAIAGLLGAQAYVYGQGRGSQPAPTPKAAAPIDITGYWVSLITEDWRYRMVTPAKGDYLSVPMTLEARKVADSWDPAKEEGAGNQCKGYGAAAIMRLPGRLHITWPDDQTLRFEMDAGTQTRLFHFGDWKAPVGEPTWQGDSVAQWETPRVGRGMPPPEPGQVKSGSLKVTTKQMRAGFLRKNGVPYSVDAVLNEYYDLIRARNGDQLLVVTTVVQDPLYLQQPFITSSQFKKQADVTGWDPTPCSSRW
jgi:hypothetical protein